MILPVVSWGNSSLKKKCIHVNGITPETKQLVIDMWHTLDATKCQGLAAPQIGHNKNIFIVDTISIYQKLTSEGRRRFWGDEGIRQTFINPEITEIDEMTWTDAEACISIPSIKIDIERPISINIRYQDENGSWFEGEYGGMTARVIQHEYDHIIGKLITDHLQRNHRKPLFYKRKLKKIKEGKVNTKYKMQFP